MHFSCFTDTVVVTYHVLLHHSSTLAMFYDETSIVSAKGDLRSESPCSFTKFRNWSSFYKRCIRTKRLANSIAMVTTKIANITILNTGNGSKLVPDVSIKVSLYPISPIIITVLVIKDVPTSENVAWRGVMHILYRVFLLQSQILKAQRN